MFYGNARIKRIKYEEESLVMDLGWAFGNVTANFSRDSWSELISTMRSRPSIFLSSPCCPSCPPICRALLALGCTCSVSYPLECHVTQTATIPCRVLFSPTPHFLSIPRSAWGYSQSMERLRTTTSSSFFFSFFGCKSLSGFELIFLIICRSF